MTFSRTSIWTPRKTHKLWPLPFGSVTPARASRLSFRPSTNGEWQSPPVPTWGTREEKKEVEPPTVEELVERASQLRAQAESMMGSAPAPSIRVQLGQVLLALDSKSFESMLKKWDQKGKGEFMKAEMRLNLRNAGLNISSAESDAMCVRRGPYRHASRGGDRTRKRGSEPLLHAHRWLLPLHSADASTRDTYTCS